MEWLVVMFIFGVILMRVGIRYLAMAWTQRRIQSDD